MRTLSLSTALILISTATASASEQVSFELEGAVVQATVEPISLRSRDFAVLVQGPKGVQAHTYPCRTLRGKIEDADQYNVFGISGDDGITLTVHDRTNGRTWSVSGPGAEAVEVDPLHDFVCGNDLGPLGMDVEASDGHAIAHSHAGTSCVRVAQIAIDCDYAFLANDFGGNVQATIDAVEDCMNQVEAIYAQFIGVTYEITAIVIREDQATDPYAPYEALGDMLGVMANEWNGSGDMAGITTDIVHMISGQPAVDGYAGLAYVGAVCTGYRFGTSRCACSGVVAHELGHNWGAGHCADTDPCNAMCGACLTIGPNDVSTMLAHRNSRTCLNVGSAWSESIPPDARPDFVTVDSGYTSDIDVLANDNDFSCDDLSIDSWDEVTERGATVELAYFEGSPLLRYTPAPNTFGTDSFSYTAVDSEGLTDTSTVSLTLIMIDDILVGPDCPTKYATASLQEAINAYAGGEDQVIYVAPGTYDERLVIDRPVVIEALSTASETIIDARGDGPVVELAPKIDGVVEFKGLTFARGSSVTGGAFSVTDTTVIARNCRFVGNSASDTGGAVHAIGGTVSLNECSFWSNAAGNPGTALTNAGGLCLVYDCDLTGNGSAGVAISAQAGTMRLFGTIACGNSGGNIEGTWSDLGQNEITDTCDCSVDHFNDPEDCNGNGTHDRCEIAAGSLSDDNSNGMADSCEEPFPLLAQWSVECGGNNHWYELVPVPDGITWSAARLETFERGGRLATLVDEAESDWVFGAVASNEEGWSLTSGGTARGPFIGLYKIQDVWRWIDGTPLGWTNWAPGQPSGNGDYGWLYGSNNDGNPIDTWDDVGLSTGLGYLVEWEAPEDCNANGSPDARDIALGTSRDADGDGIPDECVVDCPADLDGSGNVNGADLAVLLGQWNGSGSADLDDSGNVNGADLSIMLGSWGDC